MSHMHAVAPLPNVPARRLAVARTLNAVWDRLQVMQAPHGVYPVHVRWFFGGGRGPSVDAPLETIKRDLRWLADRGYARRTEARRGQPGEWAPTPAGRAWVEAQT